MGLFSWPVRVYYEDTDAGGVVYHTSYIRFLERARTEWLRGLGFSQASLARDPGVLFTVVSLAVDYRSPARLDDLLVVRSRASAAGGASVLFEQEIWRDAEGDAGGALVTATVRVACLDAAALRPRRLPDSIRKELR